MNLIKTLLKALKSVDFTSILIAVLKSVLPGWGWLAAIFARPVIQQAEDAGDKVISGEINRIDVKQGVDQVHQSNDQTKLEEALGSPNAGKPAEYRDGVQERPDTPH